MAYSELIKNFENIREYMREFYVYGFKSREEYTAKSARSYDNERRRLESWLGAYMFFRQDACGKTVFLSVDSRDIRHNPLYKAFKAKSFTKGDLILHFYILDLLADGKLYSVREIVERVSNDYLSGFVMAYEPDESTVRKKLKEYEALGLLKSEKHGRVLAYRRLDSTVDINRWCDAIAFFSEIDILGVIGSYLLDKMNDVPEYFSFKHHYILHALDSQVLCRLLAIMVEKRCAELEILKQRRGKIRKYTIFPMKVFVSTQTGRQYLLAYVYRRHKPMFFRIDSIRSVQPGIIENQHEKYSRYYDIYRQNLWGVSTGKDDSLDRLEMTVYVDNGEDYVVRRLEREKRGGSLEKIDAHTYCFTANVYDAAEMLPWIRTFIGRIIALRCSNRHVTDTFYNDLETMWRMYGGDGNAIQ